ncbi:relaxase [Hymenobacter sp. UV11]|uniref:relaxase/mobilization nuclease domain-containing protein n=1 Tax=Hymenobacter sp. UV11 TaxID=1849735 RepID=UPI00106024BB|nr:relaxase/mobilization nuclease domain-containing protein [Hymenobacter sp. UV11]TDN39614.1 hypothetical protein A8B98_18175 [Hymenobacter sp. UV11]TFZ63363.1 relaxase [Hymenobacter sp. UV11]
MIGKTRIGSSFKGCVIYQFKKLNNNQGEVLVSRGVRDYDVAAMTQDFEQQRQLNPRLGLAVWHTSISFPAEEAPQLTNDKMTAIALDYLQGMGLDKGQYTVIRHDDRPHPHFHIVANRVADDGRSVSDSHNYARSEELLRSLEVKYNLTPVRSQEKRQKLTNVPAHDRTRIRLREEVQACVQQARSLPAFIQALAEEGITAQLYHNVAGAATGISFEREGQRFKGSQLARTLSFGGLSRTIEHNHTQERARQAVVRPRSTGPGWGY